jgi:predicted Rossmann-fold nucleotide-binding protein
VLVGSRYWRGLLDWIAGPVLEERMINPEDLSLLQLTDDVDEVVQILDRARHQRRHEKPNGGTAEWLAAHAARPPDGGAGDREPQQPPPPEM